MSPGALSALPTSLAFLGNHLPRQCGIATFTTDLCDAMSETYPHLECSVLAMNDPGWRHAYPERVRFQLAERDITSYRRAADYLNVNGINVVSLQHEYGIFGGAAGGHLLVFLRELRMPVVTTLHTILSAPDPTQRDVLDEILELSERVVVMSRRGERILRELHGVPEGKIDLIPHGIPAPLHARRGKEQLGLEGSKVLMTFGLLSAAKGIELVIDALPAIVARFPETIYVVLGATHPHVLEQEGERYRLGLEDQARALGVDANIVFHDRFLSPMELAEFLGAADVYITPYHNAEQSTSGTLARALGAGKAIVSTPYAHARELLADGRGCLVPWRDPAAIAGEVITMLENESEREAMGQRAAEHGRDMVWPAVARQYHDTFRQACTSHAERRGVVFRAMTLANRPVELPESNFEHVRRLTDSTGILQHASFHVPRLRDGYCLDDNARALLLMAAVEDAGTEDDRTVRDLASRYLAFVSHAFNEPAGRFRNFMTYSRRWTERVGSEDSHGRALWALGTVVGRSRDPGTQSISGDLFHRALPAVAAFSSPRAWGLALLGIDEYLRPFRGDRSVEALRQVLGLRLFELFERASSPPWPWFEESATYENARLSQALLATGSGMRHGEMVAGALRSLDWLVSVQTAPNGSFAPIGSNGFYPREGTKAGFDQQPLDAGAMVSACLEARRVTGDEKWLAAAHQAFNWFLGHNHLHQPLYDASTGGCRDGLHVDRLNQNQGAESTLAFQLALLEMRGVAPAPAERPTLMEALS